MWKGLLILFSAGIICNTCNKNNCKTYNGEYISSDFVNYFGCYKQGSWWVYEDSTGFKDSSYVFKYSRSGGGTITNCGDNNELINEFIDITISSTVEENMEFRVGVSNNSSGMNAYDHVGEYLFGVQQDSGRYWGADSLASVNINNINYDKVLIARPLGLSYYFAPNVGVIKKFITVLNTGGIVRDFKLVKSHVVQ